MLRPGNVVFDAEDPERLASFWAALTHYVPRPLFEPYVGLRDPAGIGPNLTFQRAGDAASRGGSGRCHVDFYVADPDAASVVAEQLGARVLRRVSEGDVHWAVLSDPEGNEFCFVAAIGPDRHR